MQPEAITTKSGLNVSRETLEKLQRYHRLLLKWQESINLISKTTIEDAWSRHFLDSVQLMKYIPEGVETVADLGTGAGFPGLVLAMLRPDLKVFLIESDGKKCEFLKTVSRETDTKVTILQERIEKTYKKLRVDLVIGRALANLPKLMGHMEGYKAPKGLFHKGQAYEEEITMAKRSYNFEHEAYPSAIAENSVLLYVTTDGVRA
ncbi:MAG: 16S rRNA (guanine(527)-N(7))-methyltransferase RsmG [Micavibrio sp.]|nr:16S rRNA (guanine(527)-N(7))-methyltransferase RsmG [Micavibrio sp.]|tara:strand:+ start:1615 stop:2229 length:615 start_codon:yes stop_codon:yes gene_type:complete